MTPISGRPTCTSWAPVNSAHLFKCLDKQQHQYVRNSCAPYGDTPILIFSQLNKICLMDFIDQLFESLQPLHIRCAELSRLKKHKKQSNSQFGFHLSANGQLPTTAMDNIITVQAVAGMDESAIRTSLLMDVNLGTQSASSARLRPGNPPGSRTRTPATYGTHPQVLLAAAKQPNLRIHPRLPKLPRTSATDVQFRVMT